MLFQKNSLLGSSDSDGDQQSSAIQPASISEHAHNNSPPIDDSVAPEVPKGDESVKPASHTFGNNSSAVTTENIEVSEVPVAAPVQVGQAISKLFPGSDKATPVFNPRPDIQNHEFLAEIFSNKPANAFVGICAKSGDPTGGNWYAQKGGSRIDLQAPANRNNYSMSSSLYTDEKGNVHACKENFAALQVLVLDDVGTKVLWMRLQGFEPTYVIETSPGNYQVGYCLKEPLTDIQLATKLKKAAISAGLCDPGATGALRWGRLPVGVNGKAKYLSKSGEPFQCRLVYWNPNNKYTLEEIKEGLHLEIDAVKPSLQRDVSVASTTSSTREVNLANVAKIPALLDAIPPDGSRPEWLAVMMAVYHETGGSDEGFALVDIWSSKGEKYKGTKDVKTQWDSLKSNVEKPYTIGTLKWLAAGKADTEKFENCETVVIHQGEKTPATTAPKCAPGTVNPLEQFSLKDNLEELEKQRVEQRLILGDIVLQGQLTLISSPPNTGKTLIVLHLIIEGIKKKLIDPKKLYYINMDDNSSGLVDKLRLSVEYGFHMLADGHNGFAAKSLYLAISKMIETNTAHGFIVVIDTVKKFFNPNSKDESRNFTKGMRQYSLKGGTLVALGHCNKNPGPNGELIHAGTSDLVDDFDSAYFLKRSSEQADNNQKVVEFQKYKARGDVAEAVAYSYSTQRGLTYDELLSSVEVVDPNQIGPLKQAAELQSDAPVVSAIKSHIAEGINTKMKLADAASKRASVSKRAALKVIEKYSGNDPAMHHWTFGVQDRGAKVYQLLAPTATSNVAPTAAATDATSTANDVDSQRDAEIHDLAKQLGLQTGAGTDSVEF